MRLSLTRFRLPLLTLLAGVVLLGGAAGVYALVGQYQGGSLSTSGHPSHQPTAITNGMIVWYPFDGTLNDSTGLMGNASMSSGSAAYGAGKYGQAFVPGPTTYASVPVG